MKTKSFLLGLIIIISAFFGGCGVDTNVVSIENSAPSFEVHYIDVGQGDASLIICDGKTMLIDGGNVSDSSLVVSYIDNLGIEKIDYIVCSHAHEDHLGGLSGPLNKFKVENVFAPATGSDTDAYKGFLEVTEAQGLEIKTPGPGDIIYLGSAEVTFFGPVNEDESDLNNTSIVLKVAYGETSFLFMGDAERASEEAIIEQGFDLKSTVLKVGHHGSNYSTTYPFLREVMPEYGVISVGKDNIYNHPEDDLLSRLRDSGTTVYRTDFQGDIVITSDGKNVSISTEKTNRAVTNPTVEISNGTYIGNINSKIFHTSDCGSLPLEKNRIYFDSIEEAARSGYRECELCGVDR